MRGFAYSRAEDALEAMRSGGPSAQFLAGGTTLIDLMKLDVMRPERVVDINGLKAEHGKIDVHSSGLRLGALVHMSEAAEHPAILRDYPVIAQALQLAASQQIRNMATLGGNVLQRTRCNYFRDTDWAQCNKRNPGSGCAALQGVNRKHAVLGTSPHCIATYPGDFAQALIALDAGVEIAGQGGVRSLPFVDLHRLPGDTPQIETALQPGEIILGFSIVNTPSARRSLFVKVRDRESYEFALASAAVVLDMTGKRVNTARIAVGGVATKPWRARDAEAVLNGQSFSPGLAKRAAEAAFANAVTHGGNEHAPELGRRTLTRALIQAAAMEA